MDNLLVELIKTSPILAVVVAMWYVQRKDYQSFVTKVQEENSQREKNYQNIIDKLTDKFDILHDLKRDIEDVKEKIFK